MAKKRKPTKGAVEILHRRYYEGRPKRIAELAMLRRIAAALEKRVEIRFLPA